MRTTVCEWKSADGKHTCAIGVSDEAGSVWVWASIDGRIELECAGPCIEERVVNGVKVAASIGRLGLTAERLSMLLSARDKRWEEMKTTPAGLRRERERLVARCHPDYSSAERAWERAEESECFRLRAEENARCAKALEDLNAFDAQHPEVFEQIKEEKAAMVERHMWD